MALEQQRKNWNPESKIQAAPLFKTAERIGNSTLFKVIHKPVSDTPVGKSLEIRTKVTALNGLKWIRLRYRNINQKHDYQVIEMKESGEKDSFQATIPAENVDAKWDLMYFFEIMDTCGNGFIYPDLNEETPYYFVRLIRK